MHTRLRTEPLIIYAHPLVTLTAPIGIPTYGQWHRSANEAQLTEFSTIDDPGLLLPDQMMEKECRNVFLFVIVWS